MQAASEKRRLFADFFVTWPRFVFADLTLNTLQLHVVRISFKNLHGNGFFLYYWWGSNLSETHLQINVDFVFKLF